MDLSKSETSLITAIIVQAIKDVNTLPRRYKHNHKKIRASYDGRMARRWIESENDSPMSFKWYCGLIGMDYEWVRRKALSKGLSPSIRRSKSP